MAEKNNIAFSMIYNSDIEINTKSKKFILSAFNRTTKQNGFYQIYLDDKKDPELLSMGQYIYDIARPLNAFDFTYRFVPLKARDVNRYVVERQTASQSPNYFWTTDFKTFNPLTEIYPEKSYNWLTTELRTFKSLDGHCKTGYSL